MNIAAGGEVSFVGMQVSHSDGKWRMNDDHFSTMWDITCLRNAQVCKSAVVKNV